MLKFLNYKLLRYLSIFLFLNFTTTPVKSSSALAAWALKKNGVLELKTKSNTNLKAYFQKANQIYGDRFWVDFPGELKNPRIVNGNGPIKEIRLGKPNKGTTRPVSYTHLRAHETPEHLVCRLLLEKKKNFF